MGGLFGQHVSALRPPARYLETGEHGLAHLHRNHSLRLCTAQRGFARLALVLVIIFSNHGNTGDNDNTHTHGHYTRTASADSPPSLSGGQPGRLAHAELFKAHGASGGRGG